MSGDSLSESLPPPIRRNRALVRDLERLLGVLQEHYRGAEEQKHREARGDSRAVRRALGVLASEQNGELLGRLAWGVLGSKAAANAFITAVRDLKVAYPDRKGRPSRKGEAGDGGKPQDTIRRWFVAKVYRAFREHGEVPSRTKEGIFEETLIALLEQAGHPSPRPLRLLRRPGTQPPRK